MLTRLLAWLSPRCHGDIPDPWTHAELRALLRILEGVSYHNPQDQWTQHLLWKIRLMIDEREE